MRDALVVGRGVAALASAQLLRRRGWSVGIERTPGRAGPTLVLNDSSCELLRHVFGAEPDPLRGAHPLRGRIVAWDAAAQPVHVAQPGVVIDQAVLLGRLEEVADRGGGLRADPDGAAPRWVVDAGGRSSDVAARLANARRRVLGSRSVLATGVLLTRRATRAASAIESVAGGWLFLAPRGGDGGLLQAMVPVAPGDPAAALAEMLAQSRLVGPAVHEAEGDVTVFAAAPRLLAPLCGPGWIAVGDAAIALDPLCGDGTGHGLRGALLAAAVLEAAAGGEAPSDCLRHYETRLRMAFLDHLRACETYYAQGLGSGAWAAETAPMRGELRSDAARRIAGTRLRYALRGEKLVALG